jgi:hypothetical protein
VEIEFAVKFKDLVSASYLSPDPTIYIIMCNMNDGVTVIASNRTKAQNRTNAQPTKQHIVVAAAITIATNHPIADTGATPIFIMDGVDVDNKQLLENL